MTYGYKVIAINKLAQGAFSNLLTVTTTQGE